MRKPRRTLLLSLSIGLHVLVGGAFVAASIWKIERLEAGTRPFDLAIASDPPQEAGSPAGSPAPEIHKKHHKEPEKKIVKEPVQPPETKKPDPVPDTSKAFESASATATGTGTGSGSGSGNGNGLGSGSGSGTGNGSGSGGGCVYDCGGDKETFVPPTVIRGLRISGETQIHPPEVTKTEIMRAGKSQVVASFRVCIGTHGEISSLAMVKSSGFAGYDSALTSGLRDWRYKPYLLNDKPMPVCGMVTFVYAIH